MGEERCIDSGNSQSRPRNRRISPVCCGNSARPAPFVDEGKGALVAAGVVGLANGPDHFHSENTPPFAAKGLAAVASPALAVSAAGKDLAIDPLDVALVEIAVRGPQDVVAVVEDKAVLVRVGEDLEAGDFDPAAVLSIVEVVDELVGGVEPDEAHLVLVADALDVGNQGLPVLHLAGFVAGAVDEPGDVDRAVAGLLELLDANAGGADEIPPAAVVAMRFAAVG